MKRHFNLLAVALLLIVATGACGGDYEHTYEHATDLVISPTSMVFLIGESDSITITLAPLDALIKSVAWTSSNENVATVVNGVVTAIAAGKATITFAVTSTDKHNVEHTLEATCEVDVWHPIEPETAVVKGGIFTMGCTNDDGDCYPTESPTRSVTLSDFRMAIYLVTQREWKYIMGDNPSFSPIDDDLPVDQVSWDMIVGTMGESMMIDGMTYRENGFIYKLNELTGGRLYRLATEAEWEYAARGGNKSNSDYKYSGSNTIEDVAWYYENSYSKTNHVGLKKPNELGIYDMSGNVSEWVWDNFRVQYPDYSEIDPIGPSTNTMGKVVRGGNWTSVPQGCRVSFRVNAAPASGYNTYGFRIVLAGAGEAETKIKYTAMERIEINKNAIYIYFNSIQACIIPFSVFESEKQKSEFIEFINNKVKIS